MSETAPDNILNVASLPLDIVWGNPDVNLANVERVAATLPAETDVFVLPELFTTGFIQDEKVLRELSEDDSGITFATMRRLASQYDFAVAGSYSALENGAVYNRAFFITPDGHATTYDKRHLFSLSAEAKVYSGGNKPIPTVSFRGWNIALMVCYDLRFPVWARNVRHKYDMMLVPANWPTARGYAWTHLLIARAIENQAVYVGADRSGSDDYGDYDGLAEIVDALGRPVSRTDERCPGVLLATLSLDELRRARRRLPVVDSADDFNIICDA